MFLLTPSSMKTWRVSKKIPSHCNGSAVRPKNAKFNFFIPEMTFTFYFIYTITLLYSKKIIMKQIIDILQEISPLSSGAKTYIYEHTQRQEFKKRSILSKPGEICKYVWFIEKGLLHSFELVSPGKTICHWFMMKYDIATSVVSFFNQTNSEETVETLEDSVVHVMSREDLFAGFAEHPSLLLLTFLITTRYYCETRIMESILRKKKPEELYPFLLQHHPEMVKCVPKNHLASFMGISETTFYEKIAPKENKKPSKFTAVKKTKKS
jgi:CRP/FNR family transcriptional regulator, anaerobic regulatory protein